MKYFLPLYLTVGNLLGILFLMFITLRVFKMARSV
jgi:hypothetical protein